MGVRTPRRGLRNHMIAFFVPLTLVPLIALGSLATYLIQDAFDQQVAQRARPELSTFQRNLEFLQRRMYQSANAISTDEEIRMALFSKDRDVLRAFTGSNLFRSHFETLVLFGVDGSLLETAQQDVSDKWKKSLEELNRESEGRGPSTEAQNGQPYLEKLYSDHEGKKLDANFRAFLDRWGAWDTNVLDSEGSGLELSYFRRVVSSKGTHLGYLLGKGLLNAKELKLLAGVQGIELTLLDSGLNVVAASDPALEALFRKHRDSWAASVGRWWNVDFNEEPYAFHFSKVKMLSVGEPVWVSAGISKVGLSSLQKKIFWFLFGFVIVMAMVSIFVIVGVSNRITKPITDLVTAVDDIKQGKWVRPVEANSSNELGYLVKRFNDMASTVQVTKRMIETKLQELAAAHQELKQTQDQLVHSAKMSSLGQLVAGVAHELNNPIAFIYSNMTQMKQYIQRLDELDKILKDQGAAPGGDAKQELQSKLEQLDWKFLKEDMADIVQSCLEGSIRVKDIVLGLRNFSRADQASFSDCDVNQCLKETVKLLRGQLNNKIEIHWNLCDDSVVQGSASQLNQVFMNLVANASQAIQGRGNVWISTEDFGNSVKIRVRDDGPGIPQKHIDKVFDPFFTTKKVGDGTGLGLSIVYGIIQRHHGHIEVKSVTGDKAESGTEFVITLSRRLDIDDKRDDVAS